MRMVLHMVLHGVAWCCMVHLGTSSGGENGFSQAIELTADTLANVKFVQEKRLISRFFDEISQDTSKYTFGVRDTLSCLDMGAVETLIVWESLDVQRVTVLNPTTGLQHLHDVQSAWCMLADAHVACMQM